MGTDFAVGAGVTIGLQDLTLLVKVGQDQGLLKELLLRKIAAARAGQEGFSIADEEVEEAFATFCGERELFTEPLLDDWMTRRKLTAEMVRGWLRETLLAEKFKSHCASDQAVHERFAASPYDFAKVHVQVVPFSNQGAAAETLLQLREGECSWEQAIERIGAMESYAMRRCDAPAEALGLFVAKPGDFLGPVERDEGGFSLYRVIRVVEPRLDDELMMELRELIYRDALLSGVEPLQLLFRC